MKRLALPALAAILLLAACKPKPAERQAAPPQPAEAAEDTLAIELFLDSLYYEVFRYEATMEYVPQPERFFSHRLRDLWDEMPPGEQILDADIWTGYQDFDTLGFRDIRLDSLRADTALLSIKLSVWKGSENEARIRLVREAHDTLPPAWYVDDIVHLRTGNTPYDIAATILENMPDSVVFFHYPVDIANEHDEDKVIELRFYGGQAWLADGYMWTTSDDFYPAREGFYPGFAVLRMQDIALSDSTLSFYLDSRGESYFSGPVPLSHHTTRQALRAGCHLWGQPSYEAFYDSVAFRGLLRGDSLTLFSHAEPYPRELLFSRVSRSQLDTLLVQPIYEPENRQGSQAE